MASDRSGGPVAAGRDKNTRIKPEVKTKKKISHNNETNENIEDFGSRKIIYTINNFSIIKMDPKCTQNSFLHKTVCRI